MMDQMDGFRMIDRLSLMASEALGRAERAADANAVLHLHRQANLAVAAIYELSARHSLRGADPWTLVHDDA